MRDLRMLSGPWAGWWIQAGFRGTMRLRLYFLGNSVDGGGSDQTGAFTIGGSFGSESQRVLMTKRYSTHDVHYNGIWDGTVIHGTWTIIQAMFMDTGVFEMWPEVDEEHEQSEVEELESATALKPDRSMGLFRQELKSSV